MKQVPGSLRNWFTIHFIADIIFAVSLLFFPEYFLSFFGFNTAEPLLARLVGAALIGIGGTSLLMRTKSVESFQTMLTLKILWSYTAIICFVVALFQGSPAITWLFLAIFVLFAIVWTYYKRKLQTK
ncbi:hypothetical protein COV18_05045 [Candidatus Woesearchaeota archaeon CG10_big_fil_rev_8_21_14_0_10_37_12]|nr:MAG: hypothetical protein COV18_05045 [Candidatus Woesearchaeota archaeon CG10_big_fil_rev_8_21_14_0_10_37_12]